MNIIEILKDSYFLENLKGEYYVIYSELENLCVNWPIIESSIFIEGEKIGTEDCFLIKLTEDELYLETRGGGQNWYLLKIESFDKNLKVVSFEENKENKVYQYLSEDEIKDILI